MVITKKKVFKTALLPEYLPRLKHLFGSGFGNLAYLIAVVYNTVRILPNNHPYLSSNKKGQYSIRQVVAEAANHVSLKKENIDQIIVFFSIIAALIILLIQIILLALALLIPKSYAAGGIPDNIFGFFITPSPENDIAFHLLNLVFGIPEFFGGTAEVTEPIHTALHGLFEFYSYGILIVGIFIVLYMVITTIAETAQSGVPFGKRFNKAWTPIRIVLFFALILPITLGLNSAQYITLLSAKLGSGLASQGWLIYNETLTQENSTLTGRQEQNVAYPQYQSLTHIPAFMMVVKTCSYAYETSYNDQGFSGNWNGGPLPYAIREDENNQWIAVDMLSTTYETLAGQSQGKDVHIVFGIRDDDIYKQSRGSIAPICGSLSLSITDASQPGSAVIRKTYYDIIRNLWNGSGDSPLYAELERYSQEYVKLALPEQFSDKVRDLPNPSFKKEWEEYFENLMKGETGNRDGIIADAVEAQIEQTDWSVSSEIRNLGWAGAGIWYNTIAEQNGALISAIRSTPAPNRYPNIMELIATSNQTENQNFNPLQRFTIDYAAKTPAIFVSEYENKIAKATNYAFTFWNDNETGDNPHSSQTGNSFLDIINAILGTQGLFELCENTDIHPLAQLSALGKSMVDNSIRAFGGSAIFGLFGIQPLFGATASSVSSFFGTIASVGLLVGFVLFYVLPFMPFIYFLFAVAGWIKTIFEAMVGMPLWAIAHLRIDGEGVMGDAAMGGYYLIFEIFIRPILIIFGLLASLIIFATMVKTLNQVFYLVTANLSGHDPQSSSTNCFQNPNNETSTIIDPEFQQTESTESTRGPLDEFFFTIVYTILVYMIGTSCFKLIDSIPNQILRWVNAETSSFGDNAGQDAEGLMKYVTLGGQRFGGQLSRSLEGLGQGAQASAKAGVNAIIK